MQIKYLGELISISKGKKNLVSENPSDKAKRIIQIDDLRNDSNVIYTDDVRGVEVFIDDILIAWDGANAGLVGFAKEGFLGSTLALLRKKNDAVFYPKFLGLFLQSKFEYFQKTSTGATIPHLNRNALEKLEVQLPPFVDQIRIANLLEKIEQLIDERKKSIDLLDELIKATFYKIFGDPNHSKYQYRRLDEIASKINDGEHGTVKQIDTGVMYLMARNISKSNKLDYSEVSYVSEKDHIKMYKRCNPEPGDILLVCVGATIGKVAIIPPESEQFSIARSVALIKPNFKFVNSYYLHQLFQTEYFKDQILKNSNSSAQAGLYLGRLKGINIPIPDLNQQSEFASIANKIEEAKNEQEMHLKDLEDLYASVNQKVFNGELDLGRIPFNESLLPDEPTVYKEERLIPKEQSEQKRTAPPVAIIRELRDIKAGNFTWEQISFERVANSIQSNFGQHYFNNEMLLRYLEEDLGIEIRYYSSADKKKNPALEEADDLHSFITGAVNGKNNFLQLEQMFYNAEKENIPDISFTDEDLDRLEAIDKKHRSGIYFRIKSEVTES